MQAHPAKSGSKKSSTASSFERPAMAAKPAQVIEELNPAQSIELLKELHIPTREALNQDTRRPPTAGHHLYNFIASRC
jgi:hypothetical protein